MRLVIQRVKEASVTVEDRLVSAIGPGLLVLVGIALEDTEVETRWAISKILDVKLFANQEGKAWRGSVTTNGLEVLVVSQFTLCCKLYKKNQPDFHKAMPPTEAKAYWEKFVEKLGSAYDPSRVKDGEFGAYMDVALRNDGPVTLTLNSTEDEKLHRHHTTPEGGSQKKKEKPAAGGGAKTAGGGGGADGIISDGPPPPPSASEGAEGSTS